MMHRFLFSLHSSGLFDYAGKHTRPYLWERKWDRERERERDGKWVCCHMHGNRLDCLVRENRVFGVFSVFLEALYIEELTVDLKYLYSHCCCCQHVYTLPPWPNSNGNEKSFMFLIKGSLSWLSSLPPPATSGCRFDGVLKYKEISVPGCLSPALWLLSVSTDISHTLRVDICQEACVCVCACVVALSSPTSHVCCQLWAMCLFCLRVMKLLITFRCLPQTSHAALTTRCLTRSVPGFNSRCSSLEWNGRRPSLVLCLCYHIYSMWDDMNI